MSPGRTVCIRSFACCRGGGIGSGPLETNFRAARDPLPIGGERQIDLQTSQKPTSRQDCLEAVLVYLPSVYAWPTRT
jgi:hypothetical protein